MIQLSAVTKCVIIEGRGRFEWPIVSRNEYGVTFSRPSATFDGRELVMIPWCRVHEILEGPDLGTA